MSREIEILFRGKRLDGKGWAVGDLMHWGKSTRIYLQGAIHEVDPKTVGQYIGMNDIDDKRIFDGDIITSKYKGDVISHLVRFNDHKASYYVYHLPIKRFNNNSIISLNGPIDQGWVVEFENRITGSIHDKSIDVREVKQ